MVHWTAEEKATIASVWQKVDLENDGHNVLSRLFITYPWTKRYFSSFGNISNETAIAGNSKVHAHGKKILGALDNAAHHLDDIKNLLHDLSHTHASELHVDPENFKRLGEVFVIVLASKLGPAFTPSAHAAVQKFIAVVVDALGHGYH
ncbi:hemoglobin subunit beta-2-like [Pelobates cultripes]|uniref:Hemoglobin subunit beta-2-like n=1 Tax=Pelobates cultripes TaxID=61616 RepID=A0AAD1W5Q6_PELCU|nr:hemoglobin subunit beta-2-like [Pelobates cultripes]